MNKIGGSSFPQQNLLNNVEKGQQYSIPMISLIRWNLWNINCDLHGEKLLPKFEDFEPATVLFRPKKLGLSSKVRRVFLDYTEKKEFKSIFHSSEKENSSTAIEDSNISSSVRSKTTSGPMEPLSLYPTPINRGAIGFGNLTKQSSLMVRSWSKGNPFCGIFNFLTIRSRRETSFGNTPSDLDLNAENFLCIGLNWLRNLTLVFRLNADSLKTPNRHAQKSLSAVL
jgi:hypothetical protein